jgi:hypothetical protein
MVPRFEVLFGSTFDLPSMGSTMPSLASPYISAVSI